MDGPLDGDRRDVVVRRAAGVDPVVRGVRVRVMEDIQRALALADLDREPIAGLVESRREGREVRYTVRTEPLGETARWMAGIASQWDARLAAIKQMAEERQPDTPGSKNAR